MITFAELGVSAEVVAELGERNISEAFPIQVETIAASLAGKDLCGKAPTGSGKTLAFGLPVIERVGKGTPWRPKALILAPTRELASQIKDELAPLAKVKGRSIGTVFGGTNIERDIKLLEKRVDILVACPGRLEDLIARRCCELRDIEVVVVDEADRMADMGFLPSVKRIIDLTPDGRHTLLFSATLDGDVDQLIKRYQNNPVTVEVEEHIGEIGDVEHSWYLIEPKDRIDSAVSVLVRYDSAIVFCRTRRGCDRVAQLMKKRGLGAAAIHGDRSQSQRERALKDFSSGKAHVLVATDVAARGIHVDNVSLVMHYDPAGTDKDYIHRSGRTGRAGNDGRVVSMVVVDKQKVARQLQKELGVKPGFETLDLDQFPEPVERKKPVARDRDRKSGGDRSGRSKRASTGGSRGEGASRPKGKHAGRAGGKGGGNKRPSDGDHDRPKSGRHKPKQNSRSNQDKRRTDVRRGDGDQRRGTQKRQWSKDDERTAQQRGNRRRSAPQRRGDDSNWYPPGYDKGTQPGGKGGAKRKRRPSGEGDWRDRDEEEKQYGGSNTTQRKSRADKGRHADKNTNKNKGRRRPRGKN